MSVVVVFFKQKTAYEMRMSDGSSDVCSSELGHGSDMASCLAGVRVIDLRSGEDGEVPASALALGYRRSALAPHQLVVWADLALQEGEPDRSAALISEIVT